MDRFTESEMAGREIVYSLISGHCRNHFFTERKNAGIDMFVTGNTGTKAVLEIKNRTAYTSTDIERLGGQMIEFKKYKDLLKQKEKGYLPLYTVVFKDKMVMWDVSIINEDRFITEDKYQKTTVGEDHSTITKRVAYLKIDECCSIVNNINENNNKEDSGTTYS